MHNTEKQAKAKKHSKRSREAAPKPVKNVEFFINQYYHHISELLHVVQLLNNLPRVLMPKPPKEIKRLTITHLKKVKP